MTKWRDMMCMDIREDWDRLGRPKPDPVKFYNRIYKL